MPTLGENNKKKGKVVIVKTDACRIENFDYELFDRTFYFNSLIAYRGAADGTSFEDRYSFMVAAAMNLFLQEGVYTDETCALVLRSHDLGFRNRFPLLTGQHFEDWFMQAMVKAFDEVIDHLDDVEINDHTRVVYRVQNSTFYAMVDDTLTQKWKIALKPKDQGEIPTTETEDAEPDAVESTDA